MSLPKPQDSEPEGWEDARHSEALPSIGEARCHGEETCTYPCSDVPCAALDMTVEDAEPCGDDAGVPVVLDAACPGTLGAGQAGPNRPEAGWPMRGDHPKTGPTSSWGGW